LIKNRELGTIEPSIRGWRKKFRANKRACPLRTLLEMRCLFDTLCPVRLVLII
jgi:hypothetical protein